MKKLFLILFFLTSTAFADRSVTFSCNSIVQADNSGSTTVEAKYRRMCSQLAEKYNLTGDDLYDSECSSFGGAISGSSPLRGFRCLEARFGKLQDDDGYEASAINWDTDNLHYQYKSSSITCEVKNRSYDDVLVLFDVPSNKAIQKTFNLSNVQYNLKVTFAYNIITIEVGLDKNLKNFEDLSLFSEGAYRTATGGMLGKDFIIVECNPSHLVQR